MTAILINLMIMFSRMILDYHLKMSGGKKTSNHLYKKVHLINVTHKFDYLTGDNKKKS